MISAIVAVDNNYGIGYQNKLLEHIPEDLKYFKSLTINKVVIMGRKTYDSLPRKPLPNRLNIVITRSPVVSDDDNVIFMDLEQVKAWLLKNKSEKDIFIIGGESIYKELMPFYDDIYLTKIYLNHENVDKYFPVNVEKDSAWLATAIGEIKKHKDIAYQFRHYNRQQLIF